ncbi:MAG: tRNA adenosine(34) deaminase TadA [Candidatus Symbiodolus clandestinus]
MSEIKTETTMTSGYQSNDEHWMQQALQLADQAETAGEVPVGALVVYQGQVVGQGYNQPISQLDPTAHAEIVALRQAAKSLGNYRLLGATLYVTLEPCCMCVGALIHSRIVRLVYGADDPKSGVVHSCYPLLDQRWHNHQLQVTAGILKENCAFQLREFFRKKRLVKRAKNTV